MARDRGSILFSLWGDDDWRELSIAAQHLYMQLLSSPSLSFAGVADWRPGKLALAADANAEERYDAALELNGHLFVVMDDRTEEILLRSFLRHDGLLKKPNVVIAMAKAYAEVASADLRGVIVHELRRLKSEYPEWIAWSHPSCSEHVARILKGRAVDPKGLLIPSANGSGKGSVKGSESDPSLPLPLQLQRPTPKGVAAPTFPIVSPFCSKHPEGYDAPCRACGIARKKWEAFVGGPSVEMPPRELSTCMTHLDYPIPCPRCAEEAS